jgi:hypothetical protein
MINSLLYISRSLLRLPDQAEEIDDIVTVARTRNADMDITGALAFTETHFAQVLEGSHDALEDLMESIRRDWRHTDIQVTRVETLPERRFPDWRMAYSGPSLFVTNRIKPLLDEGLHPSGKVIKSDLLILLLREFVTTPDPS